MASKKTIKELVPVALAEDRELAEQYLAELEKHGIFGSVKVCNGYGRVREAMLYVQAEKLDEAYWIIEGKMTESCELGIAPDDSDGGCTQAA